MRRGALLLALLAGCSDDPVASEENGPDQVAVAPPPAQPPPAAPSATSRSEKAEAGTGAAEVLRRYYQLVSDRSYEEAAQLREPGANGAEAKRLAATYDDYAELTVNVGAPSEVAAAAGSLYVEVPVQTFGRMKDGRPFSSAGTVTLRRPTSGKAGWRIYGG